MQATVPTIAIRFDIDALEEKHQGVPYGEAAWRIVDSAIDLSSIQGKSSLFEGDSLFANEYVFCIVFQNANRSILDRIQRLMEASPRFREVADSQPIIIDEDRRKIVGLPLVHNADIKNGEINILVSTLLRPALAKRNQSKRNPLAEGDGDTIPERPSPASKRTASLPEFSSIDDLVSFLKQKFGISGVYGAYATPEELCDIIAKYRNSTKAFLSESYDHGSEMQVHFLAQADVEELFDDSQESVFTDRGICFGGLTEFASHADAVNYCKNSLEDEDGRLAAAWAIQDKYALNFMIDSGSMKEISPSHPVSADDLWAEIHMRRASFKKTKSRPNTITGGGNKISWNRATKILIAIIISLIIVGAVLNFFYFTKNKQNKITEKTETIKIQTDLHEPETSDTAISADIIVDEESHKDGTVVGVVNSLENTLEYEQKQFPTNLSAVELHNSLTTDNKLALVSPDIFDGEGVAVLMRFDGNYASNVSNNNVLLIYAGKIDVGSKVLDKDIKLLIMKDLNESPIIKTYTNVNGKGSLENMPLNVLEKFDSGIEGFFYSISSDNKLILVKAEDSDIKVVHDNNGNYGVRAMALAGTKIISIKDGNFQLKKGERLKDGRIKISTTDTDSSYLDKSYSNAEKRLENEKSTTPEKEQTIVRNTDDLKMLNMPIDEKRMWIEKITQENMSIEITGNALDGKTVSDYMDILEQSKHFKSVSLSKLIRHESNGLRLKKFTLDLKLLKDNMVFDFEAKPINNFIDTNEK